MCECVRVCVREPSAVGKKGRVTRGDGDEGAGRRVGLSVVVGIARPARARDLSAQFNGRSATRGSGRVPSVPRGRRRRRAGAGGTRAGIGVRTHVEFLRSLADALLEVRLGLQELLLERRLRAGEEGVVRVHPARRAHAVRVERVLVRARARAVVVLGAVRRAHLDDSGGEPKARPARPRRVPRRRPKRATTTFDETRVVPSDVSTAAGAPSDRSQPK